MRGSRRSATGSTLIELLLIIAIVSVLVGVAAPSFLGQDEAASDSVARQYLTVAWKLARAEAADNLDEPGRYPAADVLISAISRGQPTLSVELGEGWQDADGNLPEQLVIDAGATSGISLRLYAASDSGTIWQLDGPNIGWRPTFTVAGTTSGGGADDQ